MDTSETIRAIHKVYHAISNRDGVDVQLIYKGFSAGITEPWVVRVDAREHKHLTMEGAADGLLTMLKTELADKIRIAKSETNRLEKAFNSLQGN